MRFFAIAAVFLAVTGTAGAASFAIDLPLVGGIPTLTGSAGQVFEVDGTITLSNSDDPLVLGDLSITQNTTEGEDVGADTSIYYDPSNNFYNAEAPTTTPLEPGTSTTGALVDITMPSDLQTGLWQINYVLTYGDSGQFAFNGSFDVVEQPAGVPEPSFAGPLGLLLGMGILLHRRRSRSTAAPSRDARLSLIP